MPTTLPSGIQKPLGNENFNRAEFGKALDQIDSLLRPYKEEVEAPSYDAVLKIYTTVRYKREDNSLYMQAVLSNKNGTTGYYETDTWTFYAANGVTLVRTITWTYAYDADGLVLTKNYTIT